MTLNPELSKYEDVVLFPKKVEEAKETLTKNPIPAHIYLARYSKQKQEQGFEISGLLKRADADSNTFMVVANNRSQTHYTIRTVPETLNRLVKAFWEEPITVHIKPQINADNLFEYELI